VLIPSIIPKITVLRTGMMGVGRATDCSDLSPSIRAWGKTIWTKGKG
jgi:hypothetical protein